jgi:hypothetical protein
MPTIVNLSGSLQALNPPSCPEACHDEVLYVERHSATFQLFDM